MSDATKLRNSGQWRLAVWGLRVIGPGLAVVIVGLVTLVWSTGTGQTILAVGVCIYLLGVVITVVGVILVYREIPPPRPNFIQLRWSLLYDAVHERPAGAGQPAKGPDPLGTRDTPSPHLEDLRHSAHWRLAVWGARVMVLGLVVVIAGLVGLAWSAATAKVILAVGIGMYVIGLLFTLVEVRWAYREVQPPRPNYAPWVLQTLLHDAVHARP